MRPKPLLRTTLGEMLRRARREQGRTLADVARAAPVSMPVPVRLERGRRKPVGGLLAAVCEALRSSSPTCSPRPGVTSPTSAPAAPSSRSVPAGAGNGRAGFGGKPADGPETFR